MVINIMQIQIFIMKMTLPIPIIKKMDIVLRIFGKGTIRRQILLKMKDFQYWLFGIQNIEKIHNKHLKNV